MATGASPTISAPGSNGPFTYTVSATKSGCDTKTGNVGITVSGCGTTTSTVVCYEAENGNRSAGTELSSGGNASNGQYVGGLDSPSRYVDFTVGVTSAGNYPLTFYYGSGEAGGFINYSINGGGVLRFDNNGNGIPTTGGWNQFQASSAVIVSLNAGNNTIRVQGGFRFTLDKICVNGGTTTTTPPTPGVLQLVTTSYNCTTGIWKFKFTGGTGASIETWCPGAYGNRTIGEGQEQTVPIDINLRNGGSFNITAVQSGQQSPFNFVTSCNGPRIGIGESVEDTDTGLVVSPNPSSGRVSVRFVLGTGERGSLSVQSLTGAVLQSRAVVGTGAAQTEMLDMEREPSGLYLIRVSATGKAQTGRVLLMR